MSQRCDLETPRAFANSAKLCSSASRNPERAAPRVSGPPIRVSRYLDASRRVFRFAFLVIMFVHLLDIDQVDLPGLTFLIDCSVRCAQPNRSIPLPFALQAMVAESRTARAAASPSTDTRSTHSANFLTICQGIFAICFSAVLESSTRTHQSVPPSGEQSSPKQKFDDVCPTPCRSAASLPPRRRLDSTRYPCGGIVSCNGFMASPSIVGQRLASSRSATEVLAPGRSWHAVSIHRDPESCTAIAEG